jgi:hypothetical protein
LAEATAHKVARVRQAAGERFGDIELSVFAPLIAVTDDDPRQAADRLLQAFGFGLASQLSVEQVLASPQALIGSVEHIIEMLQARRQRYGLSYVVIREADSALAALREQRDRQEFERRRLGEDYADHGLVFASHSGTPLLARNVIRAFKALLARAGLPSMRASTTCATPPPRPSSPAGRTSPPRRASWGTPAPR